MPGMKRLTTLLACLALTAAGCGDDDTTGGAAGQGGGAEGRPEQTDTPAPEGRDDDKSDQR